MEAVDYSTFEQLEFPPWQFSFDAFIDVSELVDAVSQVSKLAHVSLRPADIRTEILPSPHKPPSKLPSGTQAVYAFLLPQTHCLKVGKAGPNSDPRFTTQHYGFNASSTLANSVIDDPGRVKTLLPLEKQGEIDWLVASLAIGEWLKKNTGRLHLFFPKSFGRNHLALIEGLVACRLKPLF